MYSRTERIGRGRVLRLSSCRCFSVQVHGSRCCGCGGRRRSCQLAFVLRSQILVIIVMINRVGRLIVLLLLLHWRGRFGGMSLPSTVFIIIVFFLFIGGLFWPV